MPYLDFHYQVEDLYPKYKPRRIFKYALISKPEAKKKFKTKYGYLTIEEIALKLKITFRQLKSIYKKHKSTLSYSQILEKYEI